MDSEKTVSEASDQFIVRRPLGGRFRVSEHGIFCGSLRIAAFDFDTDPSVEFRESVYRQMETALNGYSDSLNVKLNLEAASWRWIKSVVEKTGYIDFGGDALPQAIAATSDGATHAS